DDLTQFIDRNIAFLKDPDEGDPIDSQWRDSLFDNEVQLLNDAHQIGNIALTKFYNPDRNIGLHYDWVHQSIRFDELFDYDYYTLGNKFGPVGNRFDPGKLGSFFQAPEEVHERLLSLRGFLAKNPDLSNDLLGVENLLEEAVKAKQGLYITF